MSERTGIAWTERTWNPWQGCTRVSPGCAHCYMFSEKERYGQDPATVVRSHPRTFNAPLRWKDPARVFTCSWSDWFHADADAWRPEAWAIVRASPHLTFQILTKRPERILANLPEDWGAGYPNVWLGTSVENHRFADQRIGELCAVPARRRFLSCEPLLGPVSLRAAGMFGPASPIPGDYPGAPTYGPIHWVIVGGESGPKCRPMLEYWAREIRDDCAAEGVAFFLKQLGGWPDKRDKDRAVLDGRTYTEYPDP